jgi:hypothetical protein
MRPKSSADVLEAPRHRALAFVKRGLSLNEIAREARVRGQFRHAVARCVSPGRPGRTRGPRRSRASDAPAAGSEIGKTRWGVPYLEPDETAWREHRTTLEAHLPFRDFEIVRATPKGGEHYVRWPTKRRRPWTGAWTFTAPRSRSSRGSMPSS